MKILIALLSTSVMISSLSAQDQTAEPLPGQEPQSEIEKSVPLIPETAPNLSKPPGRASATDADRKLAASKTIQSETDLKQRIRLREVKTIALRDARLQELRARADAAKTDSEKREALKEYYNVLYARILKIDASLKDLANQRKQAAIDRLSQARVERPGSEEEQ